MSEVVLIVCSTVSVISLLGVLGGVWVIWSTRRTDRQTSTQVHPDDTLKVENILIDVHDQEDINREQIINPEPVPQIQNSPESLPYWYLFAMLEHQKGLLHPNRVT